MKQKIISVFLVILLIVSLLVGCSGSGSPASTDNAQSSSGDNTQSSNGDKEQPSSVGDTQLSNALDADNVNPKDKFPIVKTPIKLKVAMPVSSKIEDIDTNKFTLFLEEQTGIDLEFEVLPPAPDTMTKINLMFTTNELPDVITGYNFSYINLIDYSQQGAIIPLNDLMDAYGAEIFKVYADSRNKYVERLLTLPDGKIYAMPAIVESLSNTYNNRCWVYEPWMKTLGIDMPSSLDEFTQMLKDFKEKDPNGNNQADEIPMMGYTGTNIISYIGNSFQYTDTGNRLQLKDGKVDAAFVKPEFKETLMYLNRLCADGLFDPVTFTQDQQQWKAIVAQETPIVGVLPKEQKSAAVDVVSERGREYVIIPPLEGPNGFKTTTEILPGVAYSYVITSQCENPAAAYRLADFMLSRESSMYGRYGEKGVEWDDPDSGAIGNNGEPAIFKIINDVWGLPSSNAIWYNDNRSAFLNVHDGLQSTKDPYEYNYELMQSSINDYMPLQQRSICHLSL